jgi:hypothetical protein
MSVGLAVPAVITTNGRLDDALTVLARSKREKPSERERARRRGRLNRLTGLSRDGFPDELTQFLIRDLH